MNLELRNDTLIVKYDGSWDTLQVAQRIAASGLVLPQGVSTPTVDMTQVGFSQIPVLFGTISKIGPGKKKVKGEGRIMPPELEVGKKVLFQVQNQIAYTDKKTKDVFYLVGVGNILAFVDD